MVIDDVVDRFVDTFDESLWLVLLKTLAAPEQGGLGYTLVFFNPWFDINGYEVDHQLKTIRLDTEGVLSNHSVADVASALKDALQVEILKTHTTLLERVAWRSGKVLIGVVEIGTGLVGIVIPEPASTVAGIAVFALGSNSLVDGVSQLAGANRGAGVNLLGEAAGEVGAGLARLAKSDPALGRAIGKGAFTVASVAVGSIGSIRILKVEGQALLRLGVAGQPGGASIGRLDLLYQSSRAKDGMTILNINNNVGQSILRFVTHSGRLVVNGRIVGVERVLQHEGDARAIVKGLLKLLAYGAKNGW